MHNPQRSSFHDVRAGRHFGLSQDKELENRVMQIIEIINPIFEFLRKLAVVDDIRHCRFDT